MRISSASGIFQRTMDSLIQGLSIVVAYIDDLLLSGRNKEDHDKNLKWILQHF